MSLCSAQLIGLGTARYIVGFEPLASLEPARVVELVGPALQRYMTGDLWRGGRSRFRYAKGR